MGATVVVVAGATDDVVVVAGATDDVVVVAGATEVDVVVVVGAAVEVVVVVGATEVDTSTGSSAAVMLGESVVEVVEDISGCGTAAEVDVGETGSSADAGAAIADKARAKAAIAATDRCTVWSDRVLRP